MNKKIMQNPTKQNESYKQNYNNKFNIKQHEDLGIFRYSYI